MCEENIIKPYLPNKTAEELYKYEVNEFKKEKGKTNFVNNCDDETAVNELLNPLGAYPHAFVLACVMDRQTKAENAWRVPWIVFKYLGRFDIDYLAISRDEIHKIFKDHVKHRFKDIMADLFCCAVKRIQRDYAGDAGKIWNDTPPSGLLIYRFLQFQGVGIKIATMATNILMRRFGIELRDRRSIDISPDVHTVRVFQRLGLTSFDKDNEIKSREGTMYIARAINPEYPGIFDYPCWDVGAHYCHAQNPECKKGEEKCPFFDFCPSNKDNKLT